MKSINSTFTKADSLVSVTLHKSSFSKDGENYGKVTRNTVTLENLIAAIIEENRGLDPFLVQHSAILLQQQILKMLQQGNAVNVLDLGSLYIAMTGTVKGDKPNASDLPDFKVKFTPSQIVNEAISTLVVDKIVLADTSPQINLIIDEWTKSQNTVLTKGKTCRIEGKRLKLGGQSSIQFIMVDENGNKIEDQESITIASDKIIENYGKKISFYVPETLVSDARYKIKVETSYLSKDTYRKTPVQAESDCIFIN